MVLRREAIGSRNMAAAIVAEAWTPALCSKIADEKAKTNMTEFSQAPYLKSDTFSDLQNTESQMSQTLFTVGRGH